VSKALERGRKKKKERKVVQKNPKKIRKKPDF